MYSHSCAKKKPKSLPIPKDDHAQKAEISEGAVGMMPTIMVALDRLADPKAEMVAGIENGGITPEIAEIAMGSTAALETITTAEIETIAVTAMAAATTEAADLITAKVVVEIVASVEIGMTVGREVLAGIIRSAFEKAEGLPRSC